MELDDQGNDALVRQAQDPANRQALHALVARHWSAVRRCVARLAGRLGLRPEDAGDSEQEAYFVFVKAVPQYDLEQAARPRRCTFPTFLIRRVERSVCNGAKHLRRVARHFPHPGGAHPGADSGLSEIPARPEGRGFLDGSPDDPARVAEGAELVERLRGAISRLTPQEQWLVGQYMDGKSLRAIARALGEPYHQLRRQWRTIRIQLAAALEDWRP